MIRRNYPLASEAPSHWLLISQVEHARISHQLAAAWKELLPGAPEEVRQELLQAILHHDDGWNDWQSAPHLDPEYGRPYGFTEMPPPEAQAIWTESIDACEAIGPLAAWVVASHFIALQSKQDEDYAQWTSWLDEQNRRRAAWLSEWQAANPLHTDAIADQSLFLLQTFDWLSLWLCCRAPEQKKNEPNESLELAETGRGFGPYHFKTYSEAADGGATPVLVDPWPFKGDVVLVEASARKVPARSYRSTEELSGEPALLRWELVAGV